jgi:hypothetical protein
MSWRRSMDASLADHNAVNSSVIPQGREISFPPPWIVIVATG